jgi:hypothetical protein
MSLIFFCITGEGYEMKNIEEMLRIRTAPTSVRIRSRSRAVGALPVANPNTGSGHTEPVPVKFLILSVRFIEKKSKIRVMGP